jgi:cytochrome c biogenesis protein CcmG/thiol:disulfide interchange protein DsbE
MSLARMRTVSRWIVIGLVAAVAVARISTASHNVPSAPSTGLVGRAAPDFTIAVWNGAAGQTVHLTGLRGHDVVLNFWGSWCEACQQEMPLLQSAWQRYAGRGVEFVGVALDTPQEDGAQFLRQYGITYPCGPDPTGATAPRYALIGLPTTIVIDRHGVVKQKLSGQLKPGALDQAIHALLGA